MAENVRAWIHSLCILTHYNGSVNVIFDPNSLKPDETEFASLLLAAAAHCNSLSIFKSQLEQGYGFRPHRRTSIFGSTYEHIISKYSNEMISMCWDLKPEVFKLMNVLNYAGSLEVVQHVYERRIELHPWDFEDPGTRHAHRHILDALPRTPRVDVFNFMMDIRKTTILFKDRPPVPAYMERSLEIVCGTDNVDMAEHLLQLGTPVYHQCPDRDPLRIACARGAINVLQLLINHGAVPNSTRSWSCACESHFTRLVEGDLAKTPVEGDLAKTLVAEAAKGHHWDVVQKLSDYGVEMSGALLDKASKLGIVDLVRMLLDRGADVNAGSPHPLVTAIAMEHLVMFHLLLERGAIMSKEVERGCVEMARSEGLESMLVFLEEYGINVEEKEVDSAGVAFEIV